MNPENLIGNSSEVDAMIDFIEHRSGLAELERWLYDPATRDEFKNYKRASSCRVEPLRKLLARALRKYYTWSKDSA